MIFQKSDKVLECEGNSGEFVELVPQQLNYLGPKDLTQYFIRSTHFSFMIVYSLLLPISYS